MLLAGRMLEPDLRKRHYEGDSDNPGVRQKTLEVKTAFMDVLHEANIPFLQTDPRTPILTVYNNTNPDFYEFVIENDLVGVDGSGFKSTFEGFDGRYVRLTIESSVDKIPEVVKKLQIAYKQARTERVGLRQDNSTTI
jgi:hypothetical protein